MRSKIVLIFASVILCAALFISLAGAGRDYGFKGRVIKNVTYVKRGNQPLRMTVYVPEGAKNMPCVIVIHGGGFVSGTRKQMDPLCRTIAGQGMVVFNVEYRLAPKVKVPSAVVDVRCGVRWMASHAGDYGGDPSRLGVTGESAGGYLAAMTIFPDWDDSTTVERCPDGTAQMPPIKAAVLYYGIYDLIKSYDYDFPLMHTYYKLAMKGEPSQDPEYYYIMSPINDLHPGLPAMLLQVGDKDPLYPESENLYQKLKEMNEPVEMQVYPGANHAFAVYQKIPPGPVNLERTAEFFRQKL